MSTTTPYVLNFGAGPAKIPAPVLKRAQAELLNFDNSGMSIMELSHRSKTFGKVLAHTKDTLTQLMDIPDNYEILFMQGGATTQFSAIFYNLVAAKQQQQIKEGKEDEEIYVDYIVSGGWSSKAAQEADRLIKGENNKVIVNRVTDSKKHYGKYGQMQPSSEWQFSPAEKTAYVYYCDNETVHGVEFSDVPKVDPRVPLVADVSSNFLSKPIDVKKFGVIYGGAQKNLGPAGVSIVIVRKDLLADINIGPLRPLMLDFKTVADNDSMYNTPPTFAIYMVGLVLDYLVEQGGLHQIEQANKKKAEKLYKVIQESPMYSSPVDPSCQSRMNVVFRLKSEALEKEFLEGAEKKHMVQLKGHRSVGGIRASIYNSMPEEDVDQLIAYMLDFEKEHPIN
jgi:phosphoserine aminotransferase